MQNNSQQEHINTLLEKEISKLNDTYLEALAY